MAAFIHEVAPTAFLKWISHPAIADMPIDEHGNFQPPAEEEDEDE